MMETKIVGESERQRNIHYVWCLQLSVVCAGAEMGYDCAENVRDYDVRCARGNARWHKNDTEAHTDTHRETDAVQAKTIHG